MLGSRFSPSSRFFTRIILQFPARHQEQNRDGGIKVKKKKIRFFFVDSGVNEHISACVPKQTPFHNTVETKHCLYFVACISDCIS